jgi:hypothetical protein
VGIEPYGSIVAITPSYSKDDRAIPLTSSHLAEVAVAEGGAYGRIALVQAAASTLSGALLPRGTGYQADADHSQAGQNDHDEDDLHDLPTLLVAVPEFESGSKPTIVEPTTACPNDATNAAIFQSFREVPMGFLEQRLPFPAPTNNAPASVTDPRDVCATGSPLEVGLPVSLSQLTGEAEDPSSPISAEEFVPHATGVLIDALAGDIMALGDGLGRFLDNVLAAASEPGETLKSPDAACWLLRASMTAGMFVGFSLVLSQRSSPRHALDPAEIAALRCWFPTINTPTK